MSTALSKNRGAEGGRALRARQAYGQHVDGAPAAATFAHSPQPPTTKDQIIEENDNIALVGVDEELVLFLNGPNHVGWAVAADILKRKSGRGAAMSL